MQRIGKRMLLTGAMASALLAGGMAMSTPAMAAGDSDVVITGNAPTCVRVWVTRGTVTQTGHALNQCGFRLNLKIVWAFGADSSCFTVENGGELTSRVAIEPRRFDGASTC